MASDTPVTLRNLVIYEVYVRNHGPNGSFLDVEKDLPRIKSMGVDVIWLMPIHPIGKVERKGSLGSPYSISDYRGINPEYGGLADFNHLIEATHRHEMRLMIDVVYNHTAHDSVLVAEHPDWFNQDSYGKPVTTVPDWSDVIDLKYPNEALSTYLVDTLKIWVEAGVDGFRCDVAPLIPIEFWNKARKEVAKVKPGVIWLAESVHASFIIDRRFRGLHAASDGELYQAFDLTYDYDIWPVWRAAASGRTPFHSYLDLLLYQDSLHPANSIKMRCVENHDNQRIMALAPSQEQALAWTAFQAFNKGAFLIYAGQESEAGKTPTLFQNEKINWGNYELQPYLSRLTSLKKHPLVVDGKFALLESPTAIQAAWLAGGECLYGIFNVDHKTGPVEIQLPDGIYTNLLDDQAVTVSDHHMEMPASAAVLQGKLPGAPKMYPSQLVN